MSNFAATFENMGSLRSMRYAAIAIMSVLVAVLASAAVGAARPVRHASAACVPHRTHLIAADAQAQVYEASPTPNGDLGIYGCAYGSGRTFLLGRRAEYSPSGGGGLEHETLGGTVIAYEESAVIPCCSNRSQVVVRDLRTGRIVRRVPTGTPATLKVGYVGVGPVVSMVVKNDGAVAWIVQTGVPAEFQVHAVDKLGSQLLASGHEIEGDSLALAGSTLYWMQGGKPFSALLN